MRRSYWDLKCVVLKERMIKSRLLGDVDTVYGIAIWALRFCTKTRDNQSVVSCVCDRETDIPGWTWEKACWDGLSGAEVEGSGGTFRGGPPLVTAEPSREKQATEKPLCSSPWHPLLTSTISNPKSKAMKWIGSRILLIKRKEGRK